jgi:hypothetical protein
MQSYASFKKDPLSTLLPTFYNYETGGVRKSSSPPFGEVDFEPCRREENRNAKQRNRESLKQQSIITRSVKEKST